MKQGVQDLPGLMLATLVFMSSGCVAPSHVGAFATAAARATEDVRRGLEQVQQSALERKLSDVASDAQAPTEEAFSGLLREDTQLAPRLRTLDQLKAYADALEVLSTTDYRPRLDRAAGDLSGALRGLTASDQGAVAGRPATTGVDAAGLGKAMAAIGHGLLEHKRQAALRRVVLGADPVIQAVCADLQEAFRRWTQDRYVFRSLDSVVADMTSAYGQRTAKWSYDERLAYLKKIVRVREARDQADAFLTAAGRSAGALGQAHRALARAAAAGSLSGADVVQRVGELAEQASEARRFYDRLHAVAIPP